jgi:hypothetical protein
MQRNVATDSCLRGKSSATAAQVHSNFTACYGADDTGDIYNSANIRDFRSIVMAKTGGTRGTQAQRTRGAPAKALWDCTAAIPIDRKSIGTDPSDLIGFRCGQRGTARVLRGSLADARTVAVTVAAVGQPGGTCGTLAGVGLDLVTADGGASSDDDKNFQALIALQRCNVQHDVQHATRRLQDATHSMQRR